jgi:hypothetical protein
VNHTTNTILTESLISTLDIIEINVTNLTNLAIRTPLVSNHQNATLLHVNPNPNFLNISGIENSFLTFFDFHLYP